MCDTESVIIAIRKVVPQKYGAHPIDCAMNYCIMFDQLFLHHSVMTDVHLIRIMPQRGDLKPCLYR